MPFFIIVALVINSRIAPSYFEAEIVKNQIKITTINTKAQSIAAIFLLFSNKHKTEYVVNGASFTNYRIVVSLWGFKKQLILQKNQEGSLFESKPINLNFLGYRKYTDLLISIERLSQKMSLN